MAATAVTLNDLQGRMPFQMQSVEHLCSIYTVNFRLSLTLLSSSLSNWTPSLFLPQDVEARQSRDLFTENGDDHVDKQVKVLVIGRLEVKHKTDRLVRYDSTESATFTSQPVET